MNFGTCVSHSHKNANKFEYPCNCMDVAKSLSRVKSDRVIVLCIEKYALVDKDLSSKIAEHKNKLL